MTVGRTYLDYLQDLLGAFESASRFVQGMSFEDFADDEKTVYAVIEPWKLQEKLPSRYPLPGRSVTRRYRGAELRECGMCLFIAISGSMSR